jgi:hypothetical protein
MKYRVMLPQAAVTAVMVMACSPASSAGNVAPQFEYPSPEFNLIGAVFDDGGTATGGFDFYMHVGDMPLPQFYNIQIVTSDGNVLTGVSKFLSSRICYNDKKLFVCAPGDNFMINVETGVSGEPGYDRFQFAAYFAPSALINQIGVLDPAASYEIGCTANGCFSRHIIAGAIRYEKP